MQRLQLEHIIRAAAGITGTERYHYQSPHPIRNQIKATDLVDSTYGMQEESRTKAINPQISQITQINAKTWFVLNLCNLSNLWIKAFDVLPYP